MAIAKSGTEQRLILAPLIMQVTNKITGEMMNNRSLILFISIVTSLSLLAAPALAAPRGKWVRRKVDSSRLVQTGTKVYKKTIVCYTKKNKKKIPGILRKKTWIHWKKVFKKRIERKKSKGSKKAVKKMRKRLNKACQIGKIRQGKLPIGIPDPANYFGGIDPIEASAPQQPSPWDADQAGWYYVNNTNSGCSDAGNGNLVTPRCTIPTALSAGDVVLIEGGPYRITPPVWFTGISGTAANPVWIRGTDSNNPVEIISTIDAYVVRIYDSSYMFFENISFNGINQPQNGAMIIQENSHHLVFRNIHLENFPEPGAPEGHRAYGGISVEMSGEWVPGEVNQYHVFYDITIDGYHSGEWPPSRENGGQGFTLQDGIDHIWILDSTFKDVAEDGIHIIKWNGRHNVSSERGPHHGLGNYLYIGGNTFYRCGENAIDIKESEHVIISENIMHHFRHTYDTWGWPTVAAGGDAITVNKAGYNNGRGDESPKNAWILYNEIYDAVMGVYDESGRSTYIIGNVVHDLVTTPSFGSYPFWVDKFNADRPDAVEYIVGNTCYDFPHGAFISKAYDIYSANNIWSELRDQSGFHFRSRDIFGTAEIRNELLYDAEEVKTYHSNGYSCVNCIANSDPQFVDPANNNFQLQSTSPAIDAGITSDVYQIFFNLYGLDIKRDTGGTSRPQGSGWDIGAFEYQSN